MTDPHATFAATCEGRALLDEVVDKWSVLLLAGLRDGPQRFNGLRRRLDGITQRALSQSLRRLERNGLVERRARVAPPVAVEYALTPLGQDLEPTCKALYEWTTTHVAEVARARAAFDARLTPSV